MNQEDFEREGRETAKAIQDRVQVVVDGLPQLEMIIAIGIMKAAPEDPVDATMIMSICPNKERKSISLRMVKDGLKALLNGLDQGVVDDLNNRKDLDGDKVMARRWVNRDGQPAAPPVFPMNWNGGEDEDKGPNK